jgi:hypothetical protein
MPRNERSFEKFAQLKRLGQSGRNLVIGLAVIAHRREAGIYIRGESHDLIAYINVRCPL